MTVDLSGSTKRFQEEMSHIDPVTHVLLKGHLLIEETLVRILEQHVFHREHLPETRLTFNQKMLLCRAFCLRKNRLGEWELVAALNTLRNDLAHRLSSEERARKVQRVKDIYFREAAGYEGIEEVKKEDDAVVVMNACAHCEGFLRSFEADAASLRRFIHTMDRSLNPDLPEFEL